MKKNIVEELSNKDIPILLLTFNRLNSTRQVLNIIREEAPKRLYISSDGARERHECDIKSVKEIRSYLINAVDWDCDVKFLFHEENLGCKRAVKEGIDWFFNNEEMGVILEDDCLPSSDFFEFCKWGLSEFQNNKEIGIISGSNLVDYKFTSKYRNCFSNYINIWGWATWRDRWNKISFTLTLNDIHRFGKKVQKKDSMSGFEVLFWKNVFKHIALSDSIWDFFVQFHFFKNNLVSVYPTSNLVKNIGFGKESTHTKSPPPDYWHKSLPKENININSKPPQLNIKTNQVRDKYMCKTIWNYSPLRAIRLQIMNIIRFIKA